MIRAAENYTVRVRGDFWIRAKRPFKGGLKNLVETMVSIRLNADSISSGVTPLDVSFT